MSTENYCENLKQQRPYFEVNTLSNGVYGKPAKEAVNNKLVQAIFHLNPLASS